MKPFSFLADALDVTTARELGERARMAEDLGVTTFILPDHLQEVIDSPHIFIGSHDRFVEKFSELRERLRISSFLVGSLDELGPVVERLAGT